MPTVKGGLAPHMSNLWKMELLNLCIAFNGSIALVNWFNSSIKDRLDLQADKSPIVVKGPFFPRVVNPRYRIRGTNVWRKRWSSNAK
jgi:hypothetical protein